MARVGLRHPLDPVCYDNPPWRKVTLTLRIEHTVQLWKEGDTCVARAVPLDVLSCGETPEEARANLTDAVDLFLKTAALHGTLVEVLEECGYVRENDEWRAPKLLLSETVTQVVHA